MFLVLSLQPNNTLFSTEQFCTYIHLMNFWRYEPVCMLYAYSKGDYKTFKAHPCDLEVLSKGMWYDYTTPPV